MLRNLNVKEKILLKAQGFNPKKFLRVYKDCESYTFLEVKTGKKLVMRV
ncbi:MAG TPA: hypothetical protein VIK26_05795 [Clostridium sp.]